MQTKPGSFFNPPLGLGGGVRSGWWDAFSPRSQSLSFLLLVVQGFKFNLQLLSTPAGTSSPLSPPARKRDLNLLLRNIPLPSPRPGRAIPTGDRRSAPGRVCTSQPYEDSPPFDSPNIYLSTIATPRSQNSIFFILSLLNKFIAFWQDTCKL